MVQDYRRYTFPFVSHSASFVEDLGDQFWIFENDEGTEETKKRESRFKGVKLRRRLERANDEPRASGQHEDEQSYGEYVTRRKKRCRPCQKLQKFKTDRMDPVIKTVQSYIEDKATNCSENIRVMRDVIKSEEFKEIRTNFSQGRYEFDASQRYSKFPVVQRLRNAASDTAYLFKVRKAQWF